MAKKKTGAKPASWTGYVASVTCVALVVAVVFYVKNYVCPVNMSPLPVPKPDNLPIPHGLPVDLTLSLTQLWGWFGKHPVTSDATYNYLWTTQFYEMLSFVTQSCLALDEIQNESRAFCDEYSRGLLGTLNAFQASDIAPHNVKLVEWGLRRLLLDGMGAITAIVHQAQNRNIQKQPILPLLQWVRDMDSNKLWFPAMKYHIGAGSIESFQVAVQDSPLGIETEEHAMGKVMQGEYGRMTKKELRFKVMNDWYEITHAIFPMVEMGAANMRDPKMRAASGMSDKQIAHINKLLETGIQWALLEPAILEYSPVDFMAELLICAYMMGGVDPSVVDQGFAHLLSSQNADGGFGNDPRLSDMQSRTDEQGERHVNVVVGWALISRARDLLGKYYVEDRPLIVLPAEVALRDFRAESVSPIGSVPALPVPLSPSHYPIPLKAAENVKAALSSLWDWFLVHPLDKDTEFNAHWSSQFAQMLGFVAPSCLALDASQTEAITFCVHYAQQLLHSMREMQKKDIREGNSVTTLPDLEELRVVALQRHDPRLGEILAYTDALKANDKPLCSALHYYHDKSKSRLKPFQADVKSSVWSSEVKEKKLIHLLEGKFGPIATQRSTRKQAMADYHTLTQQLFVITDLGAAPLTGPNDEIGVDKKMFQVMQRIMREGVHWVMKEPTVAQMSPVDFLADTLIGSTMVSVKASSLEEGFSYLLKQQKEDGSFSSGEDARALGQFKQMSRTQIQRYVNTKAGWALINWVRNAAASKPKAETTSARGQSKSEL